MNTEIEIAVGILIISGLSYCFFKWAKIDFE